MLFIFNYYIPQATGKKQQAFLRAIVRKPPAAPRLPGLAECFQIFWIIFKSVSAIVGLLTNNIICLFLQLQLIIADLFSNQFSNQLFSYPGY
jgi:hypothetical protein